MNNKTVKCNDVFEWLICNINKIAVSDKFKKSTKTNQLNEFETITKDSLEKK